jgi:Mn2+/Fe2+ NRAMP family transporter
MKEPLRYPPLPVEMRSGPWWNWLKFFGPGAVIASVTIAAGETIWATRCGAIFGYALLWCFFYGVLAKLVQVYGATHYMVLTGEHPMERWAYLPGPRRWFPFLMALFTAITFPLLIASSCILMNTLLVRSIYGHARGYEFAVHLMSGVSLWIILGITWLQTYKFLEAMVRWTMGALVVCVLLAVFVSPTDWMAALQGMWVPRLPPYEDWIVADYPGITAGSRWAEIAAYCGGVAGGAPDYIGYLGLMRERFWGLINQHGRIFPARPEDVNSIAPDSDNIARGKTWLRAPAIDAAMSFGCVFAIATGFLLLGASVLHPQHTVPDSYRVLYPQAQFLTRFHPSLVWLYYLGLLFAFFGAIYGRLEVYSRASWESSRVLFPTRPVDYDRTRFSVLVYCGITAVGVIVWAYSAQKDPVTLIKVPLAVAGTFMCGLWCFAMLWTENRFLPAQLRMSRWLRLACVIAGMALTVLGARGVWDSVMELLK